MDWKEEPASHEQLLRLQEYGFQPTCSLTVTQAARLIRQYSKRGAGQTLAPPSHTAFAETRPWPSGAQVVQSVAASPVRRGVKVGEHSRRHAYDLRTAVESAQGRLEQNPYCPGGRADVQSCISARQQFWASTCRKAEDLQGAAGEALEFYEAYGAHYFPPSWQQVGEVLQALDGAMPGWDEDHPELFYETLKLNFPSLLRQK